MKIASVLVITAFCWAPSIASGGAACPWQPAPNAGPLAGIAFGMAHHAANGETVLFGGRQHGVFVWLDETWVYNGSNWTLRDVAGPPGLLASAMTYDGARERTTLFGGFTQSDGAYDGTWTWDGGAWMFHDVPGPAARGYAAMCFDAARGEVVLFGGLELPNDMGDTWVWDGAAWTQRTPMNAPTPRHGMAMAFDAARQVVVMHGGNRFSEPAGFNDETWLWNGSEWSLLKIPGPGARGYHGMAYDADREVIVLRGGLDGVSAGLDDTWEFDGAEWRQIEAPGAPATNAEVGLVYDVGRHRHVLRARDVNNVVGTWEWSRGEIEVTQAPQVTFAEAGAPVSLSVVVDDATGLTFQWMRDGVALSDGNGLSGSATAALTIDSAAREDTGAYAVRISSACGSVTLGAVLAVQCAGDTNGDGVTNFADLNQVVSNFNTSCAAP